MEEGRGFARVGAEGGYGAIPGRGIFCGGGGGLDGVGEAGEGVFILAKEELRDAEVERSDAAPGVNRGERGELLDGFVVVAVVVGVEGGEEFGGCGLVGGG